ncbi:glycosyltransferase family 4 protein [Candidatus Daviesbacteria bacterium]|nr:glycosyltransferase family 4 protein [Candidatus Daviesbacteria bacterium]
MKIVIFSWRGPGHPNAGGAEQVTLEHAKGWVKKGYDVTLFTSTFPGGAEKEIIEGVKVIRKGDQIVGVRLAACFWYLMGDHQKFDIVVDEFHGLPFFTPLFVKTKKLAFIHEVAKEVWRLNPWPKPLNLIPSILGLLFEPFIFKLLYANTPFMTVSESTMHDLIDWGIDPKNITVIHNGFSAKGIRKRYKKELIKTVIFLGALSQDKGIEEAIDVFSYIYDNLDKKWQMWVVGKGGSSYLHDLILKTQSLGVKNKIKFLGYVDNNKKFELLSRAHLLINTSVREGWGLVVIEAAAVGVPSVAFNVSGLKDSIIDKKTGLLFSYGDIKGMAEGIVQLVNDQTKYKKLAKEAKNRTKEFNWSKSTLQSGQLIVDLVG